MDPLTIATSVAKITSTSLSTGKALYDLTCKYQDAPRNMVAISSEATVISASLSQIQALILSKPNLEHLMRSRPEIAATLDMCLTGCMVLFSCLDEELRDVSRHARGLQKFTWYGRLKTVWKHETFQELLDGLRGQQLAINTLMQLLQMDSMFEISRLLQQKAPELQKSVERTLSLRRSYPGLRVAESIYSLEDRFSISSKADSVVASSGLEFDFDDIVVNSAAYRRALAAARHPIPQAHFDVVEGDLIDFSDNATLRQLPLQQEGSGIATIHDDLRDLRLVSKMGTSHFTDEDPMREHQINAFKAVSPDATALETHANAQLLQVKRKPLAVSEPKLKGPVNSPNDDATVTITSQLEQSLIIEPESASSPQGSVTDTLSSLDSAKPSPGATSKTIQKPPIKRTCASCQQELDGQFVRALGKKYHFECFTCKNCGKNVALKFFPTGEPPHEFPLCEYDYFKRLDLICTGCNGAVRGSYVTAMGKKYHAEHFTCSACPKVFGSEDSYYEHDGKVYCFEHYLSWYADLCNGCTLGILIQYVCILRSGGRQLWHPECYMIWKSWNITMGGIAPIERIEGTWVDRQGGAVDATVLQQLHERTLDTRTKAWTTLSTFEDSAASIVSDLIQGLSNGEAAVALIPKIAVYFTKVAVTFRAFDNIDTMIRSQGLPPRQDSQEQTKPVCRNTLHTIVLITTGLCHAMQPAALAQRETREQRSLVASLEFCIKAILSIGLQSSLPFLVDFLGDISRDTLEADLAFYPDHIHALASRTSDHCQSCNEVVESACFQKTDETYQLWHVGCLECSACSRPIESAIESASDGTNPVAMCPGGHKPDEGIESVTVWAQSAHLLWVALARLIVSVHFDISKLQQLALKYDAGNKTKSLDQASSESRKSNESSVVRFDAKTSRWSETTASSADGTPDGTAEMQPEDNASGSTDKQREHKGNKPSLVNHSSKISRWSKRRRP